MYTCQDLGPHEVPACGSTVIVINLYEALRFTQQKTFTIQYFPVIIDHRSSKTVSSGQGNLPYDQARSSDSTLEEVTYRPERLVDAFRPCLFLFRFRTLFGF